MRPLAHNNVKQKMKLMKILQNLLLFIFWANLCFAQKQYNGQNIDEILKLPEKDISISIATLVLAKEFYPNMNITFFLQSFDYLADRFKYYFGKYSDPNDRIAALNTYLYKPGYWNDSISFSYDDDDLHVTKLDNKFINGYISSKKGSCITMPMLYVILGEKLNFPIKPVRSAKHFFARYDSEEFTPNFQSNIEATNGGGFISNKQYQKDVLLPDKAIKNGVYLRSLTKKEYIASLLLVNANEYLQNKNIEKAKHYYKLAMKYDPTFSSAYMNYGMTVFGEARQLEDQMWNEKQEAIKEISSGYAFVQPRSDIPKPNNENAFKTEAQKQIDELCCKPEAQINDADKQTLASLEKQIVLNARLKAIEEKYKPEIFAKIAEYKEYTNKAKELGIVLEFPLQFYQKQAESIKKYRENGGY